MLKALGEGGELLSVLDLPNNLTRGKICNCIHSYTLLSIWGIMAALPKWPWAYCTNVFLWHWNILLLNVRASLCKCMWQCISPGTYSSVCLYLNFKIPIRRTSVFSKYQCSRVCLSWDFFNICDELFSD